MADAFYEYIERCIPDLYRMAFLVSGRRDYACNEVTKSCAEGASKLVSIDNERELKIELTRLLYQRYLRRIWLLPSDKGNLLPVLRPVNCRNRLLLAVRFGAGLNSEEARRATGLSKAYFYHRLANAVQAIRK